MATIQRERAQNREIQNPKVKEMIVQIIQRNPKSKSSEKPAIAHITKNTRTQVVSLRLDLKIYLTFCRKKEKRKKVHSTIIKRTHTCKVQTNVHLFRQNLGNHAIKSPSIE